MGDRDMRIIAQGDSMGWRRVPAAAAAAWTSALRAARRAAAALPSDCPLCALAARGGDLCPGCREDVLAAGRGRLRCPRCALPLDGVMQDRAGGPDAPGQADAVRAAGPSVAGAAAACPDCLPHPPAFARAVCAFDYAPPADALVLQLKRGMRLARAGLLARMLAGAMREADPPLPAISALVPIPAAAPSLHRRGFNPAAEIARALGRELGLPVAGGWLARTRAAGRQSRLGRRGRRLGAQGLYRCPVPVSGCIAVVDDVMTTGSTLDAAARALLAAGADSVLALAAARTPYFPSSPANLSSSSRPFSRASPRSAGMTHRK